MTHSLPPNYEFVERGSILPTEIMRVRQSVGWKVESEDIWAHCLAASLDVLGIRTSTGLLVGIGFLSGTLRHAVLCDLTVDEAHQGRGLGLALVSERLKRAEKLGVRYLYTTLAPANPLRSLYEQAGFQCTGSELFRGR